MILLHFQIEHILATWRMYVSVNYPDGKVHGANMGPIWGRQDPGGPHVGAMNFIIGVGYHWFR